MKMRRPSGVVVLIAVVVPIESWLSFSVNSWGLTGGVVGELTDILVEALAGRPL